MSKKNQFVQGCTKPNNYRPNDWTVTEKKKKKKKETKEEKKKKKKKEEQICSDDHKSHNPVLGTKNRKGQTRQYNMYLT